MSSVKGEKTRQPVVTEKQLMEAFEQIGIRNGSVLEVHSSLSSFGYVEGGADAVINALQKACGPEGSIFMPALRLGREQPLTETDRAMGITSKIPILPEERTVTAMGAIADTFRMRADTVTGEGVFQIAGWGKHAQEAVKGGLNYAIHNGGKALLLGVDIYKLTAMHYVEDILPQQIRDVFATDAAVDALYPPQQWLVEQGAPPVKPWYTIQEMAYQQGMIQEGVIGACKYMYFEIKPIIELYRKELQERPLELYGLAKVLPSGKDAP